MVDSTHDEHIQIISRYTDQPDRLPAELRRRIEDEWGGKPVQLYAVVDLDSSLRLSQTWVALGPDHIATVSPGTNGSPPRIRSFDRSRIRKLRERPCLSCTVLTFVSDAEDEPVLAVVRYTHRQRRAMENIKFVVEQQIAGHSVEGADPDTVYAESMARDVEEAQASVSVHRLAVIWRLLAYLKPYRKMLALGTLGAVVMTLTGLVPPYLTGKLIDDVLKPAQAGTLAAARAAQIAWLLVAGIGVTYVVRQFSAWLRLRTLSIMGEYVARDLRTHLYEHVQSLSLTFFSSKKTGSIISRVSNDTDRLWDFIAMGAVEFTLSMVMLVCLGGVLMHLDLQLGLIMTVPIPVMFGCIMLFSKRMNRLFVLAFRKWSGLTEILSDTIPGIRVVKAFNQERREIERFGAQNYSATGSFAMIHSTWTTFWPLLWFGVNCTILTVWIFAVPRLISGELTLGRFVSFVMYMAMFTWPIEMVGRITFILNRAVSSAHRIFEVLDTRALVVDRPEPVRLEPVHGRVTFENVTFAYDGVRQVLRGISFDVAPGEMIGLVGPSGAGKSTITNLIARFYDVTGGRIFIDGVAIGDLDSGHFRRQVGIVHQDPHLFHGSIVDNIRYGRREAPLDQVLEAARAANVHDFVCKLPNGYDTIVGERGHTLSGGERQRVSIARAVLTDPRILILDEATSSVDTETERKIQEALERLIAGRTVFAIAHRLSTLRRASRLLVIEDGRITESGTHLELLEKEKGTYRKLHDLQRELHEMYAV